MVDSRPLDELYVDMMRAIQAQMAQNKPSSRPCVDSEQRYSLAVGRFEQKTSTDKCICKGTVDIPLKTAANEPDSRCKC